MAFSQSVGERIGTEKVKSCESHQKEGVLVTWFPKFDKGK